MLGHQKGFSAAVVLFAVVTLLSCCSPASSFFLPRVSRTDDAIVIDFTGVGYAPSYHGKSLYGDIASPAFVPVPSVYPYPMMYRQQQKKPNGWSYSFSHPIVDSSNRQGGGAVAIAPAAAAAAAAAPQCGKGPTTLPARSLIAGERVVGTPARKNDWPFVVTLKMDGVDDGIYFCTGTLISDSKVLLAASCLENLSMSKMSQVTVLIGLSPSSDGSPPKVQSTRRIGKVAIHIKFNAINYANNIAIITLEYPVALSNFMVPVCLPAASSTDQDQYVDQDAVIVGWGTAITDPATASTALNQGKVTVSSYDVCNSDEIFGSFVSDTNFCISATEKFVCQGDIGGPLLALTSPGVWTQIGINSYASDECNKNSLHTRVSAFKAWIDTYKI